MKLVFFDLDDTLTPVGRGIDSGVVARVNALPSRGAKFVICSGKPTYYIVGLARQCQFTDGIFVGENGASAQFGLSLPPDEYCELPYDKSAAGIFAELGEKISAQCGGGVWFPPHTAEFCVFFKDEQTRAKISRILAEYDTELKGLSARIFESYDSFDILPRGLSKGNAVKFLASKLGVDKSDIIAAGNGENDISMYENAGMSIGINQDYAAPNHHPVKSIEEALDIIEARC